MCLVRILLSFCGPLLQTLTRFVLASRSSVVSKLLTDSRYQKSYEQPSGPNAPNVALTDDPDLAGTLEWRRLAGLAVAVEFWSTGRCWRLGKVFGQRKGELDQFSMDSADRQGGQFIGNWSCGTTENEPYLGHLRGRAMTIF